MGFIAGEMRLMSSLMDKMTPSQRSYTYSDESGYKFTVNCTKDCDMGWRATVEFSVSGMATDEAAIKHLLNPVEHFMRVAKERHG
jgi:hypothetical protein